MEAWLADLARSVRRREAALCDMRRPQALVLDIHHLSYLLLRWEELGLSVGPLDVPVAPQHGAAAALSRDDTHSLLSIQDTISSWWSAPAAELDPTRVLRYLHTVLARMGALELVLPTHLEAGYEDLPGGHAVPLHAFTGLRQLTLRGVDPAAVVGWDRLAVQLEALTLTQVPLADVSSVFVELVCRDTGGTLPAAAWHALRCVALTHTELTFLPAEALRALPALVHLDISSNLLNAVPPALEEASQLRALNISDNMVDSVLGIYNALPAIRALNLGDNRLESVCGVERLHTLEQVDLRGNRIADAGEIGRLATLPRISHVWIARNPLVTDVPDSRVACFAEFALEHKAVLLDDQPCGFFERRRVAERLSRRVAPRPLVPSASIEAQLSSQVRRITLTPKSRSVATSPRSEPARHRRRERAAVLPPSARSSAQPSSTSASPPQAAAPTRTMATSGGSPQSAAATARPVSPLRLPGEAHAAASLPSHAASLRARIERLQGDAGDDWLRLFARDEFRAARDAFRPPPREDEALRDASHSGAPAYPVHAPAELPHVLLSLVSTPLGAAVATGTALVGGAYLWWRFFRRIPTAAYLTPAVLRSRRHLVGRVTRCVYTSAWHTDAAWATRMASACTTRRARPSCATGCTGRRRARPTCATRRFLCVSPEPMRPRALTLGARRSRMRARHTRRCARWSRGAVCA